MAVDGVNFDGPGQFKFALVNTGGSTTYWSNDGSSVAGSEPTNAVALTVSKGLYSVLLGDATLANMTIVPATVFVNGDVHLRVWFNAGVTGFQQLTPDRRIAAVGYAMMADSVVDGAITAAKLADGAVTSEKLAAGVVQTANLAAGAVGNAQLANSTLTIHSGPGLGGGGLVSLGGNVTLSNAGVLSLTGGGGITVDASTGAVTLGSSATSAGTAGAIVARDLSGNFSASTITADLNGNAATATSFTDPLSGDVTGTQGATTIADTTITGKVLTGFTSAAGSITASDTLLSAMSKLDGNAALKAPLHSPTFTGSVTLHAGSATAAPLLLQTGPQLTTPVLGAVEFDGTNVFITNNSANPTRKTIAFTDSIIAVAQITDGTITSAKLTSNLTLSGTTSGIFSGNLTGNVTGNVSGSAASFTGSLTGDVTGTQAATIVSTVGGVTSTSLAAGATRANAATNANTASALVRRDASGDFSAGTITAALNGNASTATSAPSFTGMLTGDVTGTQGATVVSMVGTSSAANIQAAEIAANAATSANTPSTIMKRDANGDFSAATITASTFMGKGALPWVVVSGTSQQAEPNTGYVAANPAEVTITLPVTPSVGDIVRVTGAGAGGWKINQNPDQQIDTRIISPSGVSWSARESERNWKCVASSADGTKLVAGVLNGQLYTSTDQGVTWVPRESNRAWVGVTSSTDGQNLAAVVQNGQIYTSSDGGVNWVARDTSRFWTCIASSSDGSKLVAAASGALYRSTDFGVTWSLRRSSAYSIWSIACNSTGDTIAMASNGIIRSYDAGVSFNTLSLVDSSSSSRIAMDEGGSVFISAGSFTYQYDNGVARQIADFNVGDLAVSSNGRKLVGAGFVSFDGGASWVAHNVRGTPAMSSDGGRLVMVRNGGQIYTSASETTVGILGSLNGQSSAAAVELQYIGNGVFRPLSSIGSFSQF